MSTAKSTRRVWPTRPWFLCSGCVGVLVALVLAAIGTKRIVSPTVLLVLWPPSLAGIADPSTTSDRIIIGLFEFGGNFVLYGLVGMLIGLVFNGKSGAGKVRPGR
jgi:hypothetical protein